MAEPAVQSLKYNFVVISNLDESKKIDITNQVLCSDYYEDILSPCVTMSIDIANTNSLLNRLPIRGAERVQFSITTASGTVVLDEEYSMYVFKVSNIIQKDNQEFFTLHLISREGLTNETSRCLSRYSGNIKTTVEKILKDDLKTEKYNPENIELTSNTYEFIGNQKKPFSILTWLGPKSIPANTNQGTGESGNGESGIIKGVAGYFFWENSEGFNFKSIDSLVSKTKIGVGSADDKDYYSYFASQVILEDRKINTFRILSYNTEKNIDLMKSLRVGQYCNKTYFFDLYTGSMETYLYELKNEIKNTLGTDDTIPVSDAFDKAWSRLLVRTSDRGVFDNEGSQALSGRESGDMAKSASRYNLLFTQSLNMVVPCNINLKAGDIIYAEFPAVDSSSKKEADDQQSGTYLIKGLRHHFEGTQMVTSLNLIRDNYGLYG